MPYSLSDIYIGTYPTLQPFGARPDIYSARYPIRGHNGWDIACPTLTLLLAASDGTVLSTEFDSGGYGNEVRIQHDGFMTLYAHLNDFNVSPGDHVTAGQLIGHSNNTGNSDTPHLHFGIAPTDASGNKTHQDNGYGGYIDPCGPDVEWSIKNLSEPLVPHPQITPPILVDPKELSIKSQALINLSTIINFAKQNGLPDTLPDDPNGGEKINAWLADLLLTIQNNRNNPGQTISIDAVKSDVSQEEEEIDPILDGVEKIKRVRPFSKVGIALRDYIFVK